eukprot:TRINITY_DN96128_c0_g1_i1.p1 TRINITY_DN96128_c0_g1~~TRINITY_DN96128_c0_g1_i1.p1  ORF type:complete len:245 (+),score=22.33 TRINITY_DN96128_c0_g1_i1:20-754(+)
METSWLPLLVLVVLQLCSCQDDARKITNLCYFDQCTMQISSIYRNDNPKWNKGEYVLVKHAFDFLGGKWWSQEYTLATHAPQERRLYVHAATTLTLRDHLATYVIYPNGTCVRGPYYGDVFGPCIGHGHFKYMYDTKMGTTPVSVYYNNDTTGIVEKGHYEIHEMFTQVEHVGRQVYGLPVVYNQYATGPEGYFGTYQYEEYHKGIANKTVFDVPPQCKHAHNAHDEVTNVVERIRRHAPHTRS